MNTCEKNFMKLPWLCNICIWDINFKDKSLQELADNSNKLFRNIKTKGSITEKELKHFTIEFKNF